ncbi:MAG: isoaspartyl peptidase/L-asparaginase [Sinobacteraceae bacterium]|nr:isoaspartyl peptidase/L-asparaginase [Nevskiaceae bacterium]
MNLTPDPGRVRLALHGGAGDPPRDADGRAQREALRAIAVQAHALLVAGGSALDAVTLAVERLEECPLFNAGVGAVLNRDGRPELDAAVMDGRVRACGAVAGLARVKSPVRLARAILERTPHVFFAGAGAEALARELGLEMVEPDHFITDARRRQLAQARKAGAITLDHDHAHEPAGDRPRDDDAAFGTVGAVARDARGHLAAATSTGGLTNKLPGRVGDSAVIGAGTFADDDSCAVSCTGTGEAFIRAGFGLAVHARLSWCGWDLDRACAEALHAVRRYGGRGGCIAVDRDGQLALPFNARSMYRAWVGADGRVHTASRPQDAD